MIAGIAGTALLEWSPLADRCPPLAGSIRLDVIEGPLTNPTHVWDYEFGNARLPQSRITQIQNNIPNGTNVPVLEIKP